MSTFALYGLLSSSKSAPVRDRSDYPSVTSLWALRSFDQFGVFWGRGDRQRVGGCSQATAVILSRRIGWDDAKRLSTWKPVISFIRSSVKSKIWATVFFIRRGNISEYAKGYYAMYFTDPDGIKIELVGLPG